VLRRNCGSRCRTVAHELFLIVAGFLILGWTAYEFTLFRSLAGALPSDKHIDLYESFLLGTFLCVSLWIFSWRRLRDLRDQITQRSEAEQRAIEADLKAQHDPLTGLGNRARFEACLADLINEDPASSGAALLLLDLNRFKQVNDRLGHPAGDAVLKVVSLRLRSSVRQGDAVFRLGGDEFAIIAYGITSDCGPAEPGFATETAHKIIAAIDQPMLVNQHNIGIGVSVGIALYPQSGKTAEELVRRADIALYAAKKDGHAMDCSSYRIFSAASASRAEGSTPQFSALDKDIPE
jgi:diguanylate cyclase (GGDEF)-like protein